MTGISEIKPMIALDMSRVFVYNYYIDKTKKHKRKPTCLVEFMNALVEKQFLFQTEVDWESLQKRQAGLPFWFILGLLYDFAHNVQKRLKN